MKSKITRCLITGCLMLLILIMGMCLGGYHCYEKGYQDGKKVTNAWWIDKQSRYYESDEVEDKRRNNLFDHL